MKKIAVFILTVVLAMSIFAGCSANNQSAETMDFNEKLDIKKADPPPGEMPEILFVGNSHTYTNDLPGIFMRIVNAMGHEADVYDFTEGMYSLENFADTDDELGAALDEALTSYNWDFVILQENTNAAVINPEQAMLPYVKILDEKIKAAGGQTALLMTWAPKEGVDSGTLKLSREEVQTILANSYIAAAEETDALLIPAGIVFMRCAEKYPEIELWDEDNQHPSINGSYLAALTAYAVIYGESPVGCAETLGIDDKTAYTLQEIAAQTVLG